MSRKRKGLTIGKNTYFDRALYNDNADLAFYMEQFTNLSISMFHWNNLPATIDPRWLEILLFSQGKSVFFYDDVLGYLALAMAENGKLNQYNLPTRYQAYGTGYHKQCDITNSVIIWNNYTHTGAQFAMTRFASRIWELDNIIDVNAKAQKTPIIITCNEDQRLTLSNLYQKYDGNEPVIYADKNIDLKALNVLKTDAPYVGDKLYDLKVKIYNEALTYLGIPNIMQEKRERLIKDEVQRSMGGVLANRQIRLGARQEAAEKINKMFGLDISVEYVDLNVDVIPGDDIASQDAESVTE